jgi:hypothetical protein
MAEQFLVAWAVDHDELFEVVGSKDAAFAKKVLAKRSKVEELDELFEEYDTNVREVLGELVAGSLKVARAGEYRRLLELLGGTVGKSVGSEIVLPGRGWQDAPIIAWMKKAGLPKLAGVWSTLSPFPWKTMPKAPKNAPATFEWPKARFVAKKEHSALAKELAAFDAKKAPALPKRQEGLEEEAAFLVKGFGGWLKKAKGTDLVVLHDGQQ